MDEYMTNNIAEYAQISIVRYNAMLEHKHLLEMRIQELEHHIDKVESMIQRAVDNAKYDWVTIDIDDIKRVMDVIEPIEEAQ